MYDHGMIEAMNRRVYNDHPSSSIFSPNDSETCSGNDTVRDTSFMMMDGWNNFQHTDDDCRSIGSTSITQYHQSFDCKVSSLSPDPVAALPINAHRQERPVFKKEPDKSAGSLPIVHYNGWIAPLMSDQNHNVELLRRAWQFVEASGSDDGSSLETSHDTPSSNFSCTYNSQPSQALGNERNFHLYLNVMV